MFYLPNQPLRQCPRAQAAEESPDANHGYEDRHARVAERLADLAHVVAHSHSSSHTTQEAEKEQPKIHSLESLQDSVILPNLLLLLLLWQ